MTEERKIRLEQQPVEAEPAIKDTKIRRLYSKMLEEERSKFERRERNRKFATPSNSEEADLQLPSLESQIGKKHSQIREICETGTSLEKSKLYCALLDFNEYFDNELEEAAIEVEGYLSTEEDKKTLISSVNEFKTLKKIGELQMYYYKSFQTSFASLARLLNRWSSYEEEAGRLTGLLKGVKEKTLSFVADAIEKCSHEWEGAALYFDHDSEAFSVNVDMEGGLYSQIHKEAKETSRALSDFKAYAVVMEDYIKKSKLKYMPIVIRTSINNAKEENFTRYLVKDLSFFRSDLNQRRCKGKVITLEEEKRAAIPDYYEVAATPEVFENCVSTLEH